MRSDEMLTFTCLKLQLRVALIHLHGLQRARLKLVRTQLNLSNLLLQLLLLRRIGVMEALSGLGHLLYDDGVDGLVVRVHSSQVLVDVRLDCLVGEDALSMAHRKHGRSYVLSWYVAT